MSNSLDPSTLTDQIGGEAIDRIQLLPAKNDDHGGVIVDIKEPMDSNIFVDALKASMSQWRHEGKKGVWIKLPIGLANLVEIVVKEGFWYHHAEPNYLMLVYWIPETDCTIPANATHRVGVGAIVLTEKRENEKSILLGKLQGNLYNVVEQSWSLNNCSSNNIPNKMCLNAIEDAKLWHLRLGHLSFHQLKFIKPGCDVKSCLQDAICQICPATKQTRVSFPTSSVKSTKPFELLHMDIWGPHSVKSHSGCSLFLTIVDDYS